MIYLTAEQVLFIHDRLIEETGGLHGIRDVDALESAVARASLGFGDYEAHPTLFEKAAALLEAIITGHPFTDGNKRTGVAAAGIFLELNGWRLVATNEGLERFALEIAAGWWPIKTITIWLRDNSEPIAAST